MRNFKFCWLLAGIGGSAFAANAQAPAQAVPSSAGDAASQGMSEASIADIIVTATKREQRLQDVGLTVSAIGGTALRDQGLDTVADLANVVPGLQVTASPSTAPIYFLRGVGLNESTIAAYPDVASYLDQAPLSLPVYTDLTVFDLERVEVLKGPQGTLFGNNATGGAINFIAAKPTTRFQAGVDLGYARFNTADIAAFVSGPLSDTLSARLATKITKGDEWQKSYTRNDRLGKVDNVAARALLRWQPSNALDVTLNLNGWVNRSDPQAPQLARRVLPSDLSAPIGTVGPTGAVTASLPLLLYPAAPHDNRAADWSPSLGIGQKNSFRQAALNARYDIAPGIILTSITSFIDYKLRNAVDRDGVALISSDTSMGTADSTDFSQEVRLSNGSSSSALSWVVGGNYGRTKVFDSYDLVFQDSSSGVQQGITGLTASSDQSMRNIAGFANIEYELAQGLIAKGGVRYTESRRSSLNRTSETPGYVEPYPGAPGAINTINRLFGAIYTPIFCPGVTFQPVVPGGSISIDPKICQTGNFNGRLKENNVSWSVGIDYKPSRDVLFYANIAKGYKAGSFPTIVASSQAQYAAVVQESVLDYEAGVKAQLFDRKVSFNAAAFYYDYRNKQLRGQTVDPLFGGLEILINVPKSRIKGAEADVSIKPLRNLEIRLAATYLDAKISEYNGIVGTTRPSGLAVPVFASYKGVRLPFAPEFQGTMSADYSFGLSQTLDAFIGTSISAQTKSYSSPQLAPQDVIDAKIPGRTLVDLRAGIRTSDDRWRIMIWGKNIFDRYYWTYTFNPADANVRYTGRPAEYGVTIGWQM